MQLATAKVICDSISYNSIRITTFELRYWRGIHSELMTHRVFSRNAGSSRARPTAAIIEQVRTKPWGPLHWGQNQPGMRADTEIEPEQKTAAQAIWWRAANDAADSAEALLNLNVHKQAANRLLEPFSYIDVVVTATEYNNWYALRKDKDAQPEIQQLAEAMYEAHNNSEPTFLELDKWHLPYISKNDYISVMNYLESIGLTPGNEHYLIKKNKLLKQISAARCARVSYKLFDGTNPSITKDLKLFNDLVGSSPLHASPTEHQAQPDIKEKVNEIECWLLPKLHGNFRGWIQHRKELANEYIPG